MWVYQSTRQTNGNSELTSNPTSMFLFFKLIFHRYWSKLNGDGEIVWGRTYYSIYVLFIQFVLPIPCHLADPKLTPLGIKQAHVIQDIWKTESLHGLTPPHRLYCSPLSRALHTCDIMLDRVFQHNYHPVTVVEVSNGFIIPYVASKYRLFNISELSRNTRRVHLRQAQTKSVYSLIFPSFRFRRRIHRIRWTLGSDHPRINKASRWTGTKGFGCDISKRHWCAM